MQNKIELHPLCYSLELTDNQRGNNMILKVSHYDLPIRYFQADMHQFPKIRGIVEQNIGQSFELEELFDVDTSDGRISLKKRIMMENGLKKEQCQIKMTQTPIFNLQALVSRLAILQKKLCSISPISKHPSSNIFPNQKFKILNNEIEIFKLKTWNDRIMQIKAYKYNKILIERLELSLYGKFGGCFRNFRVILDHESRIQSEPDKNVNLQNLYGVLMAPDISVHEIISQKCCQLQFHSEFNEQVHCIDLHEFPMIFTNRIQFQVDTLRIQSHQSQKKQQQIKQWVKDQVVMEIAQLKLQNHSLHQIANENNGKMLDQYQHFKQMTEENIKADCKKMQKDLTNEIIRMKRELMDKLVKQQFSLLRVIFSPEIQEKKRQQIGLQLMNECGININSQSIYFYTVTYLDQSESPIIEFTGQSKQNIQLPFFSDARAHPLKIQIIRSKKDNIWIGVMDQSYYNDKNSRKKSNYISYSLWNSKIESGKHQEELNGHKVQEGEIVRVEIQKDRVKWRVQQKVMAEYKQAKLENQEIKWVYFVTMFDKGDRIRVIK